MKTIRNSVIASLIVTAAAFATPALAEPAQPVILVAAVETAPRNITLPSSQNGAMLFRPCSDECDDDYERIRLTPDTKFSVNGKRVKFDELRRVFPTIKYGEESFALVSYKTDNNTLVSLEIIG